MDKKEFRAAAEAAAKAWGCDRAEYRGEHGGEAVYSPVYADGRVRYSGFPPFILVNAEGGVRRVCGFPESLEVAASVREED